MCDIKIKDAELVRLQKGDILCLKCETPLSQKDVDRLTRAINHRLAKIGFKPDDICVVALDSDVDLSVIRRGVELGNGPGQN